MRVTTKSKRKEAANADPRQQPLEIEQSPQPKRTQWKATFEDADKQAKVNAAVNQLIENNPVSYETGVLGADRDEEFFRGKLYQFGRLKQFLSLSNEEWVKVLPNDVKKVLRQRGQSGSLARWYLSEWQTVCLRFRQIIWNEDIKELQGKEVVA